MSKEAVKKILKKAELINLACEKSGAAAAAQEFGISVNYVWNFKRIAKFTGFKESVLDKLPASPVALYYLSRLSGEVLLKFVKKNEDLTVFTNSAIISAVQAMLHQDTDTSRKKRSPRGAKSVVSRLKKMMKETGVSVAAVSSVTGISPSSICAYKRGYSLPRKSSVSVLVKLLDELDGKREKDPPKDRKVEKGRQAKRLTVGSAKKANGESKPKRSSVFLTLWTVKDICLRYPVTEDEVLVMLTAGWFDTRAFTRTGDLLITEESVKNEMAGKKTVSMEDIQALFQKDQV